MFEFLFCPQHGLLRPDNVLFIATYGNAMWTEAQCLVVRYWAVFSRWF